MDIVDEGIEWRRKKITPLFPNFTFFHLDIYNYQYNSKGRYRAGEYRFPFADASFDFVFLDIRFHSYAACGCGPLPGGDQSCAAARWEVFDYLLLD
ncbi:MAG: class I SAM-dependent methyltransferase [Candidatus Aminicenantes bacterium]|nr:class I SAM-dependent methyltransferase [Candidatus Aminicenantes bacterium]